MKNSKNYLNKLLKIDIKKSLKHNISRFFISFLFAYMLAFLPEYVNLSHDALYMFFILLFAAFLWITEAIPSFAVSFLIIALEIFFLGFHDFNFSSHSKEWMYFLKPWSSPLVFLFLAGFILAQAASKTRLDIWLAKRVLFFCGTKPKNILTGLMLITFVFSMFISNTATTAMMMTMLIPILKNMKDNNPFQKGVLLAIVVAANIGGMGTIIGTPPNAIAVGILGDNAPSFLGWMMIALPPSLILIIILRWTILKLYPSTENSIDINKVKNVQHYDDSTTNFTKVPSIPSWKKLFVIFVFSITILLWLTGPFHHIPTPVVSLLPIVCFTIFGIIDADDIREIRWDVIILIIGGLSLGLGVSKTGLDEWLSFQFNIEGLNVYLITAIFSMMIVLISNFMSNTAATNILLPLIVALVSSLGSSILSFMIISVALCASCAMFLPVSTPPNAIAYATGRLKSKDFMVVGAISGLIGPILILFLLSFYK